MDLRQVCAEKRLEIVVECFGDMRARAGNEVIGHLAGLGGDVLEGGQFVLHRIIAGAMNGDRAAMAAGHGVMNGFVTNLPRLALIDVRNAAGEAALDIAESVAAPALVAEPV